IDHQLVLAGDFLGLTPPEYIALSMLSFVFAVAVAFLLDRATHMGTFLVLACALLGAGVPYLLVSGEADKRLKTISRRLPGAIDLIALGMSAGLDFPGA